jgi:hypothetical protein
MRILIVLYSWLIIAFGSIGIGQISFHKFFSNNGYDYGHGVLQMEDSSYLVCGSSSSFTDGPSQAFLLHVDSLGNYLWSKHYGGEESDVARRVLYVPGYGYFLAGQTNSYGALAYDAYLVHTDLNGNENWHKTYGGNGWERIYDAALTKDSGVLMVGQTFSTSNGDGNMYMVRTNKLGDTLWTKNFGGIGEDALMSLDKYTDSIYYVAGYSFVGDSSQTKGIIIKLSENGDIYWMDTLGANGNYGIHGIDAVEADNKINFVGWQQTQGALTKSSYFGRMFLSGQFDFDYAEPNASGEKIYDHITQYGNNGKNYVGFRYYDNSSFQDGYDIAISRLLNGLWWDGYLQSVNYPLEDGCEELIPTSDGGAMAVGFASGNGIGGANVFLLKIGPNELFPTIAPNPYLNSLVNLPENEEEQKVSIYPNPGSQYFKITGSTHGEMHLKIFNSLGQVVDEKTIFSGEEVDADNWKDGWYFIEVMEKVGNTDQFDHFKWYKAHQE